MPKYSIKKVSDITGVNPTTIRAWERRYQFIVPSRTDSGHRLYSEKDIEKIKWIVEKQREGVSVSQAIRQLEEFSFEPQTQPLDERIKQQLFEALLNFDERTSHELVNQAFNMFSFDKVVRDVISPLLMEIGSQWENGTLTIAHEHFATAFLRARLSTWSMQMPLNPFLPRIVCVSAPEETHEIGLLFFTLYLRQHGYDVIFLGAGIPKEDLNEALYDMNAKSLIFSCTMQEHLEGLEEAIRFIGQEHPQLKIGAGGMAVSAESERFASHFLGNAPEEWAAWLSTI